MDKVIIFGTGMRMKEYKERGCFDNYEIVAFCDNNPALTGTSIYDVEIISPDLIDQIDYDNILIASDKYYNEIKKQLINNLGIAEEKIKRVKTQPDKYAGELAYWKAVFNNNHQHFKNQHYKQMMLDIACETNDMFWKDKVVVDFGCGPCGSLAWTDTPAVKIGIDVLSSVYMDNFGEELASHNMIYVTSSEKRIPLPSNYADCLLTINSLDHVDSLNSMSNELNRILKPGGVLLGSFNLNEPVTECEPQTLTEKILKETLLVQFDICSYRLAYKGEPDAFSDMRNKKYISEIESGKSAVLWLKAVKK